MKVKKRPSRVLKLADERADTAKLTAIAAKIRMFFELLSGKPMGIDTLPELLNKRSPDLAAPAAPSAAPLAAAPTVDQRPLREQGVDLPSSAVARSRTEQRLPRFWEIMLDRSTTVGVPASELRKLADAENRRILHEVLGHERSGDREGPDDAARAPLRIVQPDDSSGSAARKIPVGEDRANDIADIAYGSRGLERVPLSS